MKEHSEEFKNQIKELGRQFRSQVIYGVNTLEEELYAVTPHYEGNILKSTMKQLDIETTENIPIMTQVNYKLGMLVDGNYEWLDFGNYIVYSSEKQEDKDTYKLVCYDKLLYSMIPYLGVDGAFPMTLRQYLNAICTKLGLTFGSNTETFANYDREIPSDRYLGLEEYTYRDVLDEIAQATGSMICLNSDDELVVRYINEGEENYNTIEGTNLVITDADTTQNAQINEIQGTTQRPILPEEYQEVEYIESTGTQHFNLNYLANNKTTYELVAQLKGDVKKDGCVFGSRTSAGSSNEFILWHNNNSNISREDVAPRYGGAARTIKQYTGEDAFQWHKIELRTGKEFYVDNVYTWTATKDQADDNAINLEMFALRTGATSVDSRGYNGRVKYFKIWDNGTLVRYLVACYRKSDNVIGMYDTVTNTFYTNAGTGTFTKGNNVTIPTPDVPVEIFNVTGDNNVVVNNKNWCYTNATDWEVGQYSDSTGNKVVHNARARLKDLLYVKPNSTYYLTTNNSNYQFVLRVYDKDKKYLGSLGAKANESTILTRTFGNIDEYYLGVIIYNPSVGTSGEGQNIIDKIGTEDIKPFICLNNVEDKTYIENNTKKYKVSLTDSASILPKEYQQVEYIYSNGNQYINLMTNVTTDTRIVMDFDCDSGKNGKWLCGARSGAGATNSLALFLNSATQYWLQAGGNSATTGGYANVTSVFGRHLLDMSGTSFKVDNTELLSFTNYITNGTLNLYLLALNDNNAADNRKAMGKLYSFKLYRGNTLLLDLIPCYRKYDNTIGLYDIINNTFYVNAGTGNFTKGNDVYNSYLGIELNKIGTYVDTIKLSTGKNLLNSEWEQGTLNGNDGQPSSASNRVRTGYIDIEANTNYTFSIANTDLTAYIYQYDSEENYLSRLPSNWATTPITFTTSEGVSKIRILLGKNANFTPSFVESPQLELGTNATTPEPYGVGKWYVSKYIGKVILDGTEDWKASSTTGVFLTNTAFPSNVALRTQPPFAYSSHFNYHYYSSSIQSSIKQGEFSWSGAKLLVLRDTSLTSLTDLTTWLGNNNVTLYYVLANPTYTEITDTYLLNQLNNIQDIELYDNLCYVDWVGNVQAPMKLTYYQGMTLQEFNEEYLKDVNVDFGEKYGPINSIVLSRSGESDNVYIQDEDSIEENGLHELKIIDNQLMNFNDRSDYLEDLLEKLDGLEYYINDYVSTGIGFLELGDRYYIHIRDNTYSCIMFNDEIEVTTGLKEMIYTEMPEQTETDYTKADKTDRRINQTYLIVDKQNQKIESVVSEIGDRTGKTTSITQDIDGIEERLESMADVTEEAESNIATVSIEKVNTSEPVKIKVHPVSSPGISYLYPRSNLYPSDTMYPNERKIRFIRTYEEDGVEKTQNIDYEIPDDLLYYNESNYDEFILDYLEGTCQIIKKCTYNANGEVVLTGSVQTIDYDYPKIELWDGDYEVQLLGYNVGYIYAKLMIQNEYTTQFTTQVQTETSIAIKEREIMANVSQEYETKGDAATQYAQIRITTDEISSEVANKVGDDEVISKINQSAEAVSIQANKININGVISANGNFKVDTYGNLTAKNGTFTGGTVHLGKGSKEDPTLWLGNSYSSGAMLCADLLNVSPNWSENDRRKFEVDLRQNSESFIYTENHFHGSTPDGFQFKSGDFTVTGDDVYFLTNNVYGPTYTTISREEVKKAIKKYNENATTIVKNNDIYWFKYKTQKDNEKDHIGFIIGDNYKTPNEVISNNGQGIDTYNMCSILWKAVQEQQEKIEELENKLKDKEEE